MNQMTRARNSDCCLQLDRQLNRAHGAIDRARGPLGCINALGGDMPKLKSHLVQVGQMLEKLKYIEAELKSRVVETKPLC
jgi:hypothetical protein